MLPNASLTAIHYMRQTLMISAIIYSFEFGLRLRPFLVVVMMLPCASLTANHDMCQTLMTFAIYSFEFGLCLRPLSVCQLCIHREPRQVPDPSRPSASTTCWLAVSFGIAETRRCNVIQGCAVFPLVAVAQS